MQTNLRWILVCPRRETPNTAFSFAHGLVCSVGANAHGRHAAQTSDDNLRGVMGGGDDRLQGGGGETKRWQPASANEEPWAGQQRTFFLAFIVIEPTVCLGPNRSPSATATTMATTTSEIIVRAKPRCKVCARAVAGDRKLFWARRLRTRRLWLPWFICASVEALVRRSYAVSVWLRPLGLAG
jgi:hypothetical protein